MDPTTPKTVTIVQRLDVGMMNENISNIPKIIHFSDQKYGSLLDFLNKTCQKYRYLFILSL